MPVESIVFAGQQAWRKRYVAAPRVLPLAALAVIARLLELPPLTPPPRHPPGRALQLEERRLGQLQAMGVRAPRVLAKGEDWLALSHIGETLAGRLRLTTGDPVATDALVRMAVAAISDAHRRGAYFGQPLPRNLAVDGTRIGFLDFEEDPLEVMTLEQAQARDWLLFAYGVARYYDERPAVLGEILGEGLRSAHVEVSGYAYRVGRRLSPIARLVRGCGRSARAFAHAVLALR
ncbi:MAG: serine/threonine protein phosphatase [Luteimonas sp.]